MGIAGNVREAGLNRGEVGVMYIPQSQVPEGITTLASSVLPLSWVVRTAGDPLSLRAAIEREIRSIDSTIPITQEQTMEQVVAQSVAREHFNMVLLSVFVGIALLLAAIGVHGLMAYTVQQRTQEIGIRMALGAVRGDMLRLVLVEGMRLALRGAALGAGLAAISHITSGWVLSRVHSSAIPPSKFRAPFTYCCKRARRAEARRQGRSPDPTTACYEFEAMCVR